MREKINAAYSAVFTDGEGKLFREFQTGYVLPLHFGMASEVTAKAMADNLDKLVKNAGNKLTTGFTGTPYLLFALSDNGHIDTAYDLLLQEDCPSWLYAINNGATTIWEQWNAILPDGTPKPVDMVSYNHYAYGVVCDWLYRRMVGIQATGGGYKTFSIAPVVGGGINYANGSVVSPYGTIAVSWKIENDDFVINVTVPVSTTCTLTMPSGKQMILSSGSHTFSEKR